MRIPSRSTRWQWVPIVVLLVAIGLECFSFRTAIHESNQSRGDAVAGCSSSAAPRRPSCRSSCSRTSRALIGLVLALFGVGLTLVTGNGVWDGIGHALHRRRCSSCVAIVLADRDQEPAARRGARRPTAIAAIEAALVADAVGRPGHPHATMHLGPGGAAGRRQDRVRRRDTRGRGRPRHRRRRGAGPGRRSRSPG